MRMPPAPQAPEQQPVDKEKPVSHPKNIRSAAFTLQGLKRTMSDLGESLSKSARGLSHGRTRSITGQREQQQRQGNQAPMPNAQGPPLP